MPVDQVGPDLVAGAGPPGTLMARPGHLRVLSRTAFESTAVHRLRGGRLGAAEKDALAVEEPLEIRLNGRAVVVTMRTPGDDEDLALGFLLNEGILGPDDRVVRFASVQNPLDVAAGNIVNVAVPHARVRRPPRERQAHATSACGICGQASLETVEREFPPIRSALRAPSDVLLDLPHRMRAEQPVFDQTGGLHAAGLFAQDGELLVLREDVGRHNAVDKVVGAITRGGGSARDNILLVSGRAGFEVVQKAVAAGIPVVAAVGAPSSLAVRLAEQAGVTLVGFLRDASFNVYSHPERVIP